MNTPMQTMNATRLPARTRVAPRPAVRLDTLVPLLRELFAATPLAILLAAIGPASRG